MSEFDKKISQLTAGNDAQATDQFVVARGSGNNKIAGTDVAAAATKLGTLTSLAVAGDATITGGSLGLSGNMSKPAWTTSGVRYKNTTATLTDTTSSGTVATAYTNVFGGNTIAATNSTVFTDYASTFIDVPAAGTNVTLTNRWALALGGGLRTSGQSLSGSQAQSLIDASATWNTTGTPTAVKVNVTDTASNAASLLADLQVGGSSVFSVNKGGRASTTGYALASGGIITDATTSRTLSATDNGKVLYFTSSSAITVTTATGLGAGFSCLIVQGGTGQVTVNQGSSTTRVSFGSYTKTAGQYALINVVCPVADTFVLGGQLA